MIVLYTLLRFGRPEARLWLFVVGLLILGLGYVGFRLTKGFIGGYLKADINETLKGAMVLLHGLASLILALVLPNHYLVEIEFFRALYEGNDLWIAATMLCLLFAFLLLFGALFSLIAKRLTKKANRTES